VVPAGNSLSYHSSDSGVHDPASLVCVLFAVNSSSTAICLGQLRAGMGSRLLSVSHMANCHRPLIRNSFFAGFPVWGTLPACLWVSFVSFPAALISSYPKRHLCEGPAESAQQRKQRLVPVYKKKRMFVMEWEQRRLHRLFPRRHNWTTVLWTHSLNQRAWPSG